MKILQVVHYFMTHGMGGSELYTYYLSKELSKQHDVRLFFTIPEDNDKTKVVQGHYQGLPYWALKKNRETYEYLFQERNKWVEKEFNEVLQQFKPDLVHFQHLINLSLRLPCLAKEKGIPCCLTLHDFWLLCPRTIFVTSDLRICKNYSALVCLSCLQEQFEYYFTHGSVKGLWPNSKRWVKRLLNEKKRIMAFFFLAWWRTFWVKKIFRDVDFFIAPSQFLLEKYLQNGIAREKILFIRHGFHQTHLHDIQKTASPKMRFAFVGTIRYHKGIYVLIDAFNKITGDAELKIYGRITPSLRDDLAKRINNPNIFIMGELKEEDKRKAFEGIDVLIVPSICYENCPLVINEAFMAKIPVITSNLGGMAELVKDGEYGFTFPVGDSEQLANKIQLFIKNPDLKNHLSANLPDVKDIQTHTEEIIQLYYRLKENQTGY